MILARLARSAATFAVSAAALLMAHGAFAQCSGNPANLIIPWSNDGSWTAVSRGDDNSTGQINLPFTFTLYGTGYTRLFVNNNGNITFNEPYGPYSSESFPTANVPAMVAPFWADVDTRPAASGQAWYKTIDTNTFVVTWVNVGYYNSQTNLLNTFQVIITDGSNPLLGPGNNCAFSYDNMCWTTGSASGGSGGFGGVPATVGANAGDGVGFFQVGRFGENSSNYDGPFGNADGINYLDGRRYFLYVGSTNVPPIPAGLPVNNTVNVVAGSPMSLAVQFLAPEAGQTVGVEVLSPAGSLPAGFTSTVVPGETASVTLAWTPECCQQGVHEVDLIATDNLGATTAVRLTINVSCAQVRPVANAGGPYDVSCQGPLTMVQLDGTASSDLDTLPANLTYQWTVDPASFALTNANTPSPTLAMPRASEGCVQVATVTLVVSDGTCSSFPVSVDVSVTDDTPPTITAPSNISVVGNVVGTQIQSSVSPGTPTVVEQCFGPGGFIGIRSDGRSLGSPFFLGTTTIRWIAFDSCFPDVEALQTVEVLAPPLPDLVVASSNAPSTGLTEERFEVRWTVRNDGAAAPVRSWIDRVYLSSDNQPGGDTLLGTFGSPLLLAPGQEYTRAESLTFPVAPGTYWVVLVIDQASDVVELAGDGNNTVVMGPITVQQAPKPDLTMVSVTPPTSGVVSGSLTEVSFRVRNQGTGATSSAGWTDTVLLLPTSSFTSLNPAQVLATPGNPAYLPAGDEYVQTIQVRLPSDIEGQYYLAVYADSQPGGAMNSAFRVRELVESNNFLVVGPFSIALEPQPDLQVTGITKPAVAFSSTEAQIGWTDTNVNGALPRGGDTDVSNWFDTLWLSQNNTTEITSGDIQLIVSRGYSQTTVPGGQRLQPGQAVTSSAFVRIPSQLSGNYFVKVLSDSNNRVSEFGFENNNVGVSASPIDIRQSPPVDLIPTTVTGPSSALRGFEITVGWTGENDGAPPGDFSFSWTDRLYLSADQAFDASDVQIALSQRTTSGSTGNITIPPYSVAQTVRVPTSIAPGTYYLIAVVDSGNDVSEDAIGETNNALARSAPIVIGPGSADLVPSASGTPPTTGTAGGALSLAWQSSNLGTSSTPVNNWIDRVYLSTDAIRSGGDIQIGVVGRTGALAINGSYTASISTSVPLVNDGNYFLLVVTDSDNQVFEDTGEGNNVLALPFTVAGGAADLSVTNVTAPSTAVANQNMSYSFVVTNLGEQATTVGSWVDEVYLTPAAGGPATRVVARTRSGVLAAQGTYTVSGSFVVPQTFSGLYILSARTDVQSNVFETSESNNSAVAGNQTDISPGDVANLAVSSVIAPSTATSGQPIPLSITIENRGSGAASGSSWRDSIYLSRDQFLDPDTDVHLITLTRSAALSAGQNYLLTPSPTIPAGATGPYFVIVRTDSGGAIYEAGQELDNTSTSANFVDVALPPPGDLSVASVTPPATAVLGQTAPYAWSILNSGTTTLTASWKDSLFLSTDPIWSIDDKRIGSFNTSASALTPGNAASSAGSGATPPVTPGDYYVVTRADVFNQVLETDEANNIGASGSQVSVTAIPLLLGSAFTGPMGNADGLYFQLDVPAGETVRITYSHPNPNATTELFVRYGVPPTTGEFDFVHDAPGSSAQEVVIPTTQAGRYYLLAKVGGGVSSQPVNLLANILPFSVVSAGPAEAGNVGDATLRIRGARFTRMTKAALIGPGNQRIVARRVQFKDSATLMATFPLAGQPAGSYGVEVYESHEEVTIDEPTLVVSVLEVLTAQASTPGLVSVVGGGGPQLQLDYGLPAAARAGANFPITIVVRNEGNNDLPAPIIGLQSPNATPMRLGSSGVASTDIEDIQVVALGRESFRDVLRPGESVVYRATALAVRVPDSLISATDLSSNPGVIPWDEFEADLRFQASDAAWAQTWQNFKMLVGSTWSEYGHALRTAAEDVKADTTQPVTVSDLLQPLLAQASATLDAPRSPAPRGDRSGNPYGDCSITTGCTCPPGYGTFEQERDKLIVRALGQGAYPFVPDAIEQWLSGSGSFTGSGTWTYPGSGCSGRNCAALGLLKHGEVEPYWAFVKSQAVSGISSNAEQIARSLSCNGSRTINLTDPLIGIPASSLNKIAISMNAGAFGTGLGQLLGHASLSISGNVEVTLVCDRCTQCPQRLNLKLNITLTAEDCYDFCPGARPSEAFARLEACGIASAGIPVTITGTMNGIPLSGVSVPSSASNDPCCNPNRPPIRPPCGQSATDPCADCRRGRQIQGPRCPPPKPVPTVTARDPNEKAGPAGFSVERWISSANPIPYHIDYENVPTATAPAATVTITDPLDADLNPGTFRLGAIRVGDLDITVPPNLISWSTTVDLTATRGVLLRIDAGIDASTTPARAFWIFQSIDPATGEPPTNGLLGFLPPNDATGRGTGYVEFTIRPRRTVTTGTQVVNAATIVFDNEAPLDTNVVSNTLDGEAPISSVVGAPPVSTGDMTINVAAADQPTGSGLSEVQLFVSDNGGAYEAFGAVDPALGVSFQGSSGHVYRFVTRAVDNAGNAEALPSAPQAVSVVPGVELAPASDTGVVGDSLTNSRTPTLSFFSVPDTGATIAISGPVTRSLNVTADGAGLGSASVPAGSELPDGEYTATLTVSGVSTSTTFTVDGTAPSIQSVRSAQVHGAAGELAIDVLSSGLSVEGRQPGVAQLLVRFAGDELVQSFESSAAVQLSGIGLNNQPVALGGTQINIEPRAGGDYSVTFTPALPNAARYCLTFVNVTDAAGNLLPASGARFSFLALAGDATGDRRVNNTDVGAINALVGTNPINPLNPNHIRADLNRDGQITSADVALAVAARGQDARFIGEPCPAGLTVPVVATDVQGSTLLNGQGVDVRRGDLVVRLRDLRIIDEAYWQIQTRKAANRHGDAVGTFLSDFGTERAMIRYNSGDVKELGTLGGPRSFATAINEAGQVVGYSDTASGEVHAFRWDPNTGMMDLGTVFGPASMAFALNEAGQVTGSSSDEVRVGVPFLHLGTGPMAGLGSLGGEQGVGLDISDARMVVGSSSTAGGSAKAVSWTDQTGLVDLNTMLPEGSEWNLIAGDAVGDDGAIYGRATFRGVDRAFRLALSIEPWCRADVDRSGAIGPNDIFAFLQEFFAGSARADFDNSGTISTQDLFAFLQGFFAGCN